MLPATHSEKSAPLAETKTSAVDDEPHSGETGNRADDLLRLPDHVLVTKVLTFLGYKDYTLTARTCQHLKRLWVEAMKNLLFVPGNCNTFGEAVNRVHGDDRLTTIVYIMMKKNSRFDYRYILYITWGFRGLKWRFIES